MPQDGWMGATHSEVPVPPQEGVFENFSETEVACS